MKDEVKPYIKGGIDKLSLSLSFLLLYVQELGDRGLPCHGSRTAAMMICD